MVVLHHAKILPVAHSHRSSVVILVHIDLEPKEQQSGLSQEGDRWHLSREVRNAPVLQFRPR